MTSETHPATSSIEVYAALSDGSISTKTELPIIQTLPVPKGSPEFEEKRNSILQELASKVPLEYRISRHYVSNPPKDVSQIPRECAILSDTEIEITEQYDATALAQAIAAGKFSAVSVAQAFIKRSIICHQVSCCLTQWMPELAIKRAQELDDYFARTGKTVGPLHGVPVSVKQHIALADTYSEMGSLATRIYDTSDSVLVANLRNLGAVFYCKTAQPQAIMHLETNGYHGRTLNPYNIDLSSGGSSGGESALIALRGSILGVGTDIGGSIRAPAGFVGIYGFKPTANTLPLRGCIKGSFPAELNVLESIGPLCTSLRDVDLFMRGILDQNPHIQDPRVVPIPWQGLDFKLDISASRPLKVGIMFNDGIVQPQPPVLRALQEAQNKLQTSSLIEVKPYKPYNMPELWDMAMKIYSPDGGNPIRRICEASGEPLHQLTLTGMQNAKPIDAEAISNTRISRDSFRAAFSEDWQTQDVDVILSPLYIGPAPPHDTAEYVAYTALWNLVDCPGIAFPTDIRVGKKGVEKYGVSDVKAWSPLDERVRELWEECDYEGAPVSLQLTARKHCDGMLLAALEVMRDVLQLEQ